MSERLWNGTKAFMAAFLFTGAAEKLEVTNEDTAIGNRGHIEAAISFVRRVKREAHNLE